MSKKVKIVLVGVVFLGAALCVGNEAMARLHRDSVRSVHIRDGEVRNQDLAVNAVTTDKIAPDTIINADIAPGAAIDAGKIADGPGSGLDADTVDGIEGAQISTNQAGIDNNANDIATNTADIASHNHDGIYERLYNNVITIAPDGNGDYTDPVAAIASITDNSINTPYLLKLMPGVYDIGTSSVQMKEYVDIEGSGENTTKITGTINSPSSGVVNGADNAELRLLIVENTGGGTYAIAIYNNNASPKLTQVSASAPGGSRSYGVLNDNSSSPTMIQVTATALGGTYGYGVLNDNSSSPTMIQVTATAFGGSRSYGVLNNNSSPMMSNVTATASGGSDYNYGVINTLSGTVRIDHCVISGSTATIYNESGVTTYVGNTRLDGGPVSNFGTITCAGVYDENYTFYANTCP